MNEIGGFFGLELTRGNEYHNPVVRLNLGRTAFEYILRAKKVRMVYLPHFICGVMFEPLTRIGIPYQLYHINDKLEPLFDFTALETSDYFLYVNYFGMQDSYIDSLSRWVPNLIIDNSQAFFTKPLPGVDTFYSPRKFFGTPDGGYLFTDRMLPVDLERDDSSDRFSHLIGRIEKGTEESYADFSRNEEMFSGQPIRQMSRITRRILQGIDYERVKDTRSRNFQHLHEKLKAENLWQFTIPHTSVPMVYPFLTENPDLRDHLIRNKVFIPQYWPDVLKRVEPGSVESRMVRNITHIPVDQRYNPEILDTIIDIIHHAR